MSHPDLFTDKSHAALYSKFRPSPPNKLISIILSYLEKNLPKSEWKIGVDVGCGSGQCTRLLSHHFENVFGYDVSEAQINEAEKNNTQSNVQFKVLEQALVFLA